jgi:hypothetical protein
MSWWSEVIDEERKKMIDNQSIYEIATRVPLDEIQDDSKCVKDFGKICRNIDRDQVFFGKQDLSKVSRYQYPLTIEEAFLKIHSEARNKLEQKIFFPNKSKNQNMVDEKKHLAMQGQAKTENSESFLTGQLKRILHSLIHTCESIHLSNEVIAQFQGSEEISSAAVGEPSIEKQITENCQKILEQNSINGENLSEIASMIGSLSERSNQIRIFLQDTI